MGYLALVGRGTHPQLHHHHHPAKLHNRMPAVLKPDAWPLWLGEQPAELAKVKALLVPYPFG